MFVRDRSWQICYIHSVYFPYVCRNAMARTIRNPKIDSRSARAKLPQRPEPYWTVISEGCALGYRRGSKGGKWIARFRDDMGRQHYEALGAADDARDPDNLTAFSFTQAQAKARDVFTRKAREVAGDFVPTDGPFTVADALTAYLTKYLRRGGKASGRIESAARTYILPALGQLPVTKLTKRRLEEWHHGIANSAARVRTRKGEASRFRPRAVTPEANRQRGATANRVLTILKAALNDAYHEGRIPINEAWQRVKAFRKVDSARIRYLTDDEARRLVNASPTDFRSLVVGGLMTGCRYGELTALVVEDFNVDSETLIIRTSKSGKPRHVVLSDEGSEFFARQCFGKVPGALLFTKASGRKWSASDQQRPLAAACVAAKISPITFHGLRHTYASRLAMKGVPLAVIAAQLGHADIRMVEKHYGHLAPNYVADTVRAAFDNMGLVWTDNVVPLTG
jgi:integrase